MTEKEIRSAIEAILFANGGSVTIHQLAQSIETTESVIKNEAESLVNEYAELDRGITIIKLNKSYQMVSVKKYASYIRKAMDLRRNIPLSQAALEVLAVVAYNQPVTKSFIEQVRGVDCSGVLGSLATKDLIEEKGRLELPGRPLLYGTTENFLRCFSLTGIDDLPPIPTKEDGTIDNSDLEKDEELSIFKEENSDDNQDEDSSSDVSENDEGNTDNDISEDSDIADDKNADNEDNTDMKSDDDTPAEEILPVNSESLNEE